MSKLKKVLLTAAAMGTAITCATTPASAATTLDGGSSNKPLGGCPPGWFLYPTAALPADTSGQPSLDGNGDGWSCVILIASENPMGLRFAAVDNTVPL
jgi:hypothetical protein